MPSTVAWSFVAPSSINADGADLALGRHPYTFGNEVTIAMHDDNAGVPGTILRSVTVSDSLPVAFEWGVSLTRAAFSSSYPLTNGTTYWIVVTMPNDTAGVWFLNGPTSGNICAGGRVGAGMRQWPSGDAWPPYPEVNMLPTCSAAFRVTSP